MTETRPFDLFHNSTDDCETVDLFHNCTDDCETVDLFHNSTDDCETVDLFHDSTDACKTRCVDLFHDSTGDCETVDLFHDSTDACETGCVDLFHNSTDDCETVDLQARWRVWRNRAGSSSSAGLTAPRAGSFLFTSSAPWRGARDCWSVTGCWQWPTRTRWSSCPDRSSGPRTQAWLFASVMDKCQYPLGAVLFSFSALCVCLCMCVCMYIYVCVYVCVFVLEVVKRTLNGGL